MTELLAVGVGGFLGAIARYGVALLVALLTSHPFPVATILINVAGSFALGFLGGIFAEHASVDPARRLFFTTGFLGAFTTFSTFEYETLQLATGGAMLWAVVNVVASVGLGFVAVYLGALAAR